MKRTGFIGIDISKKKLDIVIYDQVKNRSKKHFKVSNDLQGFEKLISTLKTEGIKLNQAIVCLEYCGIYGLEIGFFLEGKVDFSFCAPLKIKRSLGITRGKSDKIDALKIAHYCYLHRDELILSSMPSKAMLELKNLMSERNRLVKTLKIEKQIVKEFSKYLNKPAIERVQRRIKILNEDLKSVEKEIVCVIKTDKKIEKNYDLLKSIIGIGMVNAVMMILCTRNFEGITNARSFACYCGVAPFEYSSGTSIHGKTRVSHLANKKMKANLTNAARSAVINDPELRIYYKRKKAEGKEHGTVMNAIKFKIITRAFAVINRQTPFVKLRQAG